MVLHLITTGVPIVELVWQSLLRLPGNKAMCSMRLPTDAIARGVTQMTFDAYESELELICASRRGEVRKVIDHLQHESDFGSAGFRSPRTAPTGAQLPPPSPAATGNSNLRKQTTKKS